MGGVYDYIYDKVYIDTNLAALGTSINLRAPLVNPSFTGTISGIT